MFLMLIRCVGKDNYVVDIDACEANTSISIGVEVRLLDGGTLRVHQAMKDTVSFKLGFDEPLKVCRGR